MVTLEQIKERYPEGCEVECILNKQKSIVKHSEIRDNGFYFYLNNGLSCIYLYNEVEGFANTIKIKKQDKPKRYKEKEVHGMDVIDLAKFWNLNFNEASILKYLLRDKGDDVGDMWKIVDFAQREHEYLTNNKNN